MHERVADKSYMGRSHAHAGEITQNSIECIHVSVFLIKLRDEKSVLFYFFRRQD